MNAEFSYPKDKIFFVETSIGLIAAARSMVMDSGRKKETLDLLDKASDRVYSGLFTEAEAECLVEYCSSGDLNNLMDCEKLLAESAD